MRQRFYGILIAGLGLLVMSRPYTAQADARDPNLQGDWRVVSVFRDGSLSPVSKDYIRVLIYDNKIVFTHLSGREDPDIYRIDASRTPNALDVEWHIQQLPMNRVPSGVRERESGR